MCSDIIGNRNIRFIHCKKDDLYIAEVYGSSLGLDGESTGFSHSYIVGKEDFDLLKNKKSKEIRDELNISDKYRYLGERSYGYD